MDSIADEFVQKIVERAKSFRLGRGDDENNHIGPSVDEGQFNTVLKYIDIGREDGAELVCGENARRVTDSTTDTSSSRQFSIASRPTCGSPEKRYSDRCFRFCV